MKERTHLNQKDRNYSFELSAELSQFCLRDELAKGEVEWTDQEVHDNLALRPGMIFVGTNCDRVVPVSIQLVGAEPPINVEPWDHVVDCSIDVSCGRLVVFNLFEDFAIARIDLEAGRYRARVCYGNQYASEDHIDCADYYVVMLWRSKDEVFEVLKRRVDLPCSLIG